MSEETQTTEQRSEGNGSSIMGVSLRGWLAFLLVLTVCGMSVSQIVVEEPLYSLATLAVGFYFGQNIKKP